MTQSLKTLFKLTAAVATMGLLVGCATQAEIEDVRAMAESAMVTAESAEAQARDAQATADENSEKIDRMFERSMYK